jgi:hypothetical protein
VRDGAVTLTATQLRLLFTGMDWTQLGMHIAAVANGEKNVLARTSL